MMTVIGPPSSFVSFLDDARLVIEPRVEATANVDGAARRPWPETPGNQWAEWRTGPARNSNPGRLPRVEVNDIELGQLLSPARFPSDLAQGRWELGLGWRH